MKKIGLIAGNGIFPLMVAEEAKNEGNDVFSCAITTEASKEIENFSRSTCWVKLGELGKILRFFKKNDVSQAVLAGKITKTSLFSGHIRPDLEMIKALASIRDWKDDSLLRGIVNYLEKKGVSILDSTHFLKKSLLEPGLLTKRKPTKSEMEDIEFGRELAKEMGRLDVGQTVIVKGKAVLAIEAIEGTDEAIRRGAQLGKGGAVVVKVAKPEQDMRFDVPTIGLSTLKVMKEAGAEVLAIEAKKTIVLELESVIDFANANRIAIVVI